MRGVVGGDALAGEARGFADPRRLAGTVGAWLGLYSLYRPDAVVVDHAPAALLAAHIHGLSHLALGTGFTIPPSKAPMPSMRPWKPDAPAALKAVEAAVLSAVNAVARHHRHRGFAELHELFPAASSAICTFPELDHYGRRAQARYIGPTFVTDAGAPLAWRGKGAKVFAYLRATPVLDALLAELARLRADAIVYAPGAGAPQQRAAKAAGVQLSAEPVRLDRLLGEADVVISSAGHGLLSAGLLAGAPALLVPTNVEELRAAARAFAGRYKDYNQRRSQETLLALALEAKGGAQALHDRR
jgi:UDP:flavonoid glycosyltransferase YjiC (YdhE family)